MIIPLLGAGVPLAVWLIARGSRGAVQMPAAPQVQPTMPAPSPSPSPTPPPSPADDEAPTAAEVHPLIRKLLAWSSENPHMDPYGGRLNLEQLKAKGEQIAAMLKSTALNHQPAAMCAFLMEWTGETLDALEEAIPGWAPILANCPAERERRAREAAAAAKRLQAERAEKAAAAEAARLAEAEAADRAARAAAEQRSLEAEAARLAEEQAAAATAKRAAEQRAAEAQRANDAATAAKAAELAAAAQAREAAAAQAAAAAEKKRAMAAELEKRSAAAAQQAAAEKAAAEEAARLAEERRRAAELKAQNEAAAAREATERNAAQKTRLRSAAETLAQFLRDNPTRTAFGFKGAPSAPVQKFQQIAGITSDGIVGPDTRKAAARTGVTLPLRPSSPAPQPAPEAAPVATNAAAAAAQVLAQFLRDNPTRTAFGFKGAPSAPVQKFQHIAAIATDGILGPDTRAAGRLHGVEFPLRPSSNPGIDPTVWAAMTPLQQRESVANWQAPAAPRPAPAAPVHSGPPGYDPALARALARTVAQDLHAQRYDYDRAQLRRFQRAAAIAPDGIYGGGSAAALKFYGIKRIPKPLFRPSRITTYTPPAPAPVA